MTENLIHSLPPTTALPPFVTFEDCKKGETAAKTGCTPASGEGGKSDGYEKKIAKIVDEAAEGDPGEAPAAPSKLPEELAGFSGAEEMFEEQGWDMEEAEVSSELDHGGLMVDVEGEEWAVFPNAQAAERHAVERVKEDIEESPEMFDQNFIRQYVSFSPTDVRLHAGDLADSDLEAAVDNGDVDEDDQDAVDDYLSERYEEHKKGLAKDPREYYVDEMGFGDDDWFFKTYPNAIDADDAAQAAVDTDGVAHFLSGYDGEEVEAGETLWYRHN